MFSAAIKSGAAGNPTDPKFNYVTMLLHGNGTNGAQNNTFVDSSTNNFTITRNGNTTQGTFTPYGSNWSNYFSGSSDYLSTPASANMNIGTGDFTYESWIYPTSYSSARAMISFANVNVFYLNTSGIPYYGIYLVSDTAIGTTAVSLNTWSHIAFVRSGTTLTCYINGTSVGSITTASSIGTSINTNYLGYHQGGNYWSGYMSNARVVKGTAVYTGNFTPSTTPLTAITNTQLLTCQSNRFIDNSTNAFTVTVNGSPSVQRFSPFSPTTAYSTSVIGGSGYFDGSGDYLNTPTSGQFAPTGDFTVSFWYYPTTLNTYNTVIGNYTSTASTDWFIEFTSNGSVNVYTNGSTVRITGGSGTIKSGQWSFVTLSRSGTTITFRVNGTSIGTYTQSGTFGSATKTIYIGQYFNGSEYITGYLSDVRLLDGSEVTTIPTAPLTSVSGTNLLLNFTNAGILDNAMMNDLETVGNAQISTSVKKYGTGSLAFDGTDDRLTTASSPNMSFGTGDFTIEGWFYINSGSGTNNGALQISGTTGGLQANQTTNIALYSADSSGIKWGAYYANTYAYGSASTTQTWTHVALVRSSGSLKLYINGTADATFGTKTDTTNYTGQNICVGGYYSTAYLWNGYIDDLRITKGVARYTANFTPPTAAFPNN